MRMASKKQTLKRENFVISSLYFKEECYGNPGHTYLYCATGDKATIISTDILETDKNSNELTITPDEFNNKIYNLINNWKRNYKPKFDICDGLMWKLEIELRDGTKYKFAGYHEIPENFEEFEDYLNNAIGVVHRHQE